MNNRPITSAVALTIAGGLALAGCSSSDSDSTDSTSTSTSVSTGSATSSSAGAAAAGGEKVAGATVAKKATDALKGAKSFELANQTPMASQSSIAKVAVRSNGKMDTNSTYKVGSNTIEVVTMNNGATMYARAPKVPMMQIPKWTRIDPQTKDPVKKKVASTVTNLVAPSAPWNALKLLESLQLTKSGEETVNGVKTTKYVADVPAKVMLGIASAEQRQLLASVLGDKTSPLVLNVDSAGRPVKQTLTMNVGGDQPITSTWSKFGAPVSVKTPA